MLLVLKGAVNAETAPAIAGVGVCIYAAQDSPQSMQAKLAARGSVLDEGTDIRPSPTFGSQTVGLVLEGIIGQYNRLGILALVLVGMGMITGADLKPVHLIFNKGDVDGGSIYKIYA